ncbi:nuclear factor, interleukin 3 regulated, member 4 [Carassius auratus]|uniref:Nuclear factor, interleukin 3 regulated, member 4 n=1 Tax=Carassius auratus TaxID=7957 RepID=A0A6P6J166_CARAU|nr:nuclear factor interleukin-3-regulated protein-like [Carassius auratus]XP_052447307.1 nuclear factor, interleukin 3 regulated, member 4 [Carassius gibelio]
MESAFSRVMWETEGEAEELSPRGLGSRRKREFIPEEKKDATYWEKRRKNNEAAKRSREKRRVSDYVLETRLVSLSEENARLRAELLALKLRCGLLNPGTPYSPSHRALSQLHALAPQPLISCPDKDLYWSRRQDREGSHLSGSQQAPLCLGTHPGSAFLPTHPMAIRRNHPYLLDFPSLHSSTASPLLLPPHLAPAAAPWAGRPLLSQPGNQRILSDEEGEQQVPADSSTALPHKLRLKTQNSQRKDSRAKSASPNPTYISD